VNRPVCSETDIDSRVTWERIINVVVTALEQEGIRYHLDASSSLYAHGVEFDMDDLDVTVEWGKINTAHALFSQHNPGTVTAAYPPSFRFYIDSREVHVMSYQSETGIGSNQDRTKVKVAGTEVWCKTIEFYKRNMTPSHRLWGPLHEFMQKSVS